MKKSFIIFSLSLLTFSSIASSSGSNSAETKVGKDVKTKTEFRGNVDIKRDGNGTLCANIGGVQGARVAGSVNTRTVVRGNFTLKSSGNGDSVINIGGVGGGTSAKCR